MKPCFFSGLIAVASASLLHVVAADAVFSGPQPGEKTTPFKVLDLTGRGDAKERDPIAENAGAPTALVFVSAVERSLVPLLNAVDEYGFERKDRLKTEVVFLFKDRLEGEQKTKAVNSSLKLAARVGLSVDGAEGPGNYGLNKECLMTLIAAKENLVVTNFALVQPGIADAPRVIAALAKLCGDTNPPSIEQLVTARQTRTGGMARDRAGMAPDRAMTPARDPNAPPPKPLPGAVPTDPTLNGLLRQVIRITNDVARVDQLMVEVKTHIKGNPDLTQQTIDGWTRTLSLTNYFNAYSRKVNQEFLDQLKATPLRP